MPEAARFDMSVSAHDVAAELRRQFGHKAGDVKIHKLLYYVQGWHLVWFGRPLFAERIEAWTNGPVVADLWRDEKHGRNRPPPRTLDGDGRAALEYVVGRYGGLTGRDLIRRSHNEDPWRNVSENDDGAWAVANPEIAHEAMFTWFQADEEHVAHVAEVDRLRSSAAYSFDRPVVADDLEAAVTRALDGERVHPSQLS